MNPAQAIWRDDWRWLTGFALILLLAHVALLRWSGLDLHYDEAQYWAWAQHPDLGYYSKGPWIAWVHVLRAWLLPGDSDMALRFPAWLASVGIMLGGYGLARMLYGNRRHARWAAALVSCNPVMFTLGGVMTTDVWLFLFWMWTLYWMHRAVVTGHGRGWLYAGVLVGLGLMTKLSMALLPMGAAFASLWHPAWRQQWSQAGPWCFLLVMVLVSVPMWWWNAGHDWVLLRHELGHIGQEQHFAWPHLTNYLAAQWLLMMPLLLPWAIYHGWHCPDCGSPGRRFLWLLFMFGFVFFLIKSLGGKVQPNWAAMIYLGMWVLVAGGIAGLQRCHRVLVAGLVGLSFLLVLLMHRPYAFGLDSRMDPYKDARAWQTPIHFLAGQAPTHDFLLTGSYKLASELKRYWGSPQRVLVYPHSGRRRNQFDLWGGWAAMVGKRAVYVGFFPTVPDVVQRAFAYCQDLPPVMALAPDGGVIRTLYAHDCHGFKHLDWPTPQGY